jgi:hypothetical protein
LLPFAEPVTTVTDYALAAAGVACTVSLLRFLSADNRVSGWFWCGAFLASAVAGIAGGTWHGFPAVNPDTRDLLWSVAMSGIGAAIAFVFAAIHAADVRLGDGTVKWLIWAIGFTAAGVAIEITSLPVRSVNENDVYHVLQIAALWCLYRCARTVRDRGRRV